MTANGIGQIVIYLLIILLLVKPLGWYMARVYEGQPCGLDWLIRPLEKFLYSLCKIEATKKMHWQTYLIALLIFNLLGLLLVYLIQRSQFYLPLNPQHFLAPSPHLSFNSAISFTTNTDWQAYSGETKLSYFTQMLAITVQQFISAATGMSILIALTRGIRAKENPNLGNFWVDMTRSILYILLPLSLCFAVFLTSQGVIQNFKPNQKINLLTPLVNTNTKITEQIIPMGPVASQVAIKQLGSNGGGFFNVNAAHPFENPTPLTNFFELLAILLIPAALCYTFGKMVKDPRQGWAILVAMFLILVPFIFITYQAEQQGNLAFQTLGINQIPQDNFFSGGNMEGKETRFGIVTSALWTTATTAASNGSVNSMLDSYTPLGGGIPLWMMHLGEVVFGGVGTGLYSMLLFIILTVFVAGLMIGRTPEYLGKKIEPIEIKMVSIAVLIIPLSVLIYAAIAVVTPTGVEAIGNPGIHGFTEILYAFTSMAYNNGSAFAGLNSDTPFYTVFGGIVMLLGRYWIAIPTLVIAGSLATKKIIPASEGTLQTYTPLFIIFLSFVIIIVGALSFLPALALGPIVEELILRAQHG